MNNRNKVKRFKRNLQKLFFDNIPIDRRIYDTMKECYESEKIELKSKNYLECWNCSCGKTISSEWDGTGYSMYHMYVICFSCGFFVDTEKEDIEE